MPRTITIHPLSLALGLVFGGLCLLSMSQTGVTNPVRIEYMPHPRDMVQIKQGTPYLVPAGKIFCLTGLGAAGFGTQVFTLSVNGVQEASVFLTPTTPEPSVAAMTAGFTAPGGSTIDVAGAPDARAWGYLVHQ